MNCTIIWHKDLKHHKSQQGACPSGCWSIIPQCPELSEGNLSTMGWAENFVLQGFMSKFDVSGFSHSKTHLHLLHNLQGFLNSNFALKKAIFFSKNIHSIHHYKCFQKYKMSIFTLLHVTSQLPEKKSAFENRDFRELQLEIFQRMAIW